MKITALIPAGGKGIRMGSDLPKQFIELEGRSILSYTLSIFEKVKEINEVYLIVPQDDTEFCLKNIIEKYHFRKVRKIIAGGKKRQDSVYNGLKELKENTDLVIVHDGVRPFVDEDILRESIKGAINYDGAVTGIQVKDTIKEVSIDGTILKTIDRSNLWLIQTPQTFRKNILIEAYNKAIIDNFYGTDDASLVERLGYKLKIIKGSPKNMKITTPEDLIIATNIIRYMTKNP